MGYEWGATVVAEDTAGCGEGGATGASAGALVASIAGAAGAGEVGTTLLIRSFFFLPTVPRASRVALFCSTAAARVAAVTSGAFRAARFART